MKANHVKWEPMWEKYFSNFHGLEPVVECRQMGAQGDAESQAARDTIEDIERYNTSCYSVSDPLISSYERFYPVEKDEDMGFNINTEHSLIKALPPVPASELKISSEFPEANHDPKEHQEITCEKAETLHLAGKREINEYKRIPIVKSAPTGNQPANIIFECGTGQGFTFVARDGETLTHTPFRACIAKTIGIAAIDTTFLKHPKTKVMFSCMIDFTSRAEDSAAQLEFVLSRSCNDGPESPIGNWVYDIARVDNRSQSFKFNFCSCNSFPGCYNYYVRVLPVYIKNCSICITNCYIEAFAQSIIT